jgi:hypothetical protein
MCGPSAASAQDGSRKRHSKSLAQKAARGLSGSECIAECDLWKVWLDALRNEKRNFDESPIQETLSTQEWDKLALPATKGVVESLMITDKMAESIRQLGFAAEPGTIKTRRRFEGIAGVIRDLFETSANYCVELEAGAPHPQSRQTTPDGVANAQAGQVPPAPATKEDRGGKQVRWNAPIERVKQKIRQLHGVGSTQKQICERLGNSARPKNAAWRELAWPEAFRNLSYRAAVKSWISRIV